MHPVEGDDAIGEILVPAEDLRRRVRELAAEVSRDYEGKDLVLVGVLKGAVLFLSDLMRALDLPHGVRALVEGGKLRFVAQEPKPRARSRTTRRPPISEPGWRAGEPPSVPPK